MTNVITVQGESKARHKTSFWKVSLCYQLPWQKCGCHSDVISLTLLSSRLSWSMTRPWSIFWRMQIRHLCIFPDSLASFLFDSRILTIGMLSRTWMYTLKRLISTQGYAGHAQHMELEQTWSRVNTRQSPLSTKHGKTSKQLDAWWLPTDYTDKLL